jgi:hypothetical protein
MSNIGRGHIESRCPEESCVEIEVGKASWFEINIPVLGKGLFFEQNLVCNSELLGVGSTGKFLSIPRPSSIV